MATTLSPEERLTMFHRQLDLIHPEEAAKLQVTVIGAGAIGSFTVLALAKIGVTNITVYDEDTVEDHNLPNQYYRLEDIGKKKVVALAEIVEAFTGVQITPVAEMYVAQPVSGVVISGVDSMDARMEIWKNLKGFYPDHYLDARMGAEVGQIFAVEPANFLSAEEYEEKKLFPSTEATPGACTARSTMFCANGLASLVTAQVSNIINGRRTKNMTIDFRNFTISEPVV